MPTTTPRFSLSGSPIPSTRITHLYCPIPPYSFSHHFLGMVNHTRFSSSYFYTKEWEKRNFGTMTKRPIPQFLRSHFYKSHDKKACVSQAYWNKLTLVFALKILNKTRANLDCQTMRTRLFQFIFQVFCSYGISALRHLLGSAGGHHFSPMASTVGTKVDDVVGTFYHVHVVLDDDDSVALCH